MRATALLLIALAALPFSCGSDSDSLGRLASGCTLTSECNAGLVCTFGRCHQECETSVDCPDDGRCVKVSGDNHVCVLPEDDEECTYNAMCASPLVCAVDQRCRNQCTKPRDCIDGQVCATTGVCADTDEVDDSGNLIDAVPGGGGAGGGAGETSSGATGNSGAGETSSSGTGNSGGAAGAGALPCQGVLPGGGCSYCPLDSCENGDCVSGDQDYSCECLPGYSGTGTKTCTLSDPCLAELSCPAEYPCAPTQEIGGFSCVGQFASWPMPDTQAPDGATPNYSGAADTAVDTVTRLEWQRATPADCTPAGDPGPVACDWANAKSYCEVLDLGGETDWRLPSKIELESLLDCVHSFTPLIDEVVFPNTVNGRYWSSSPVAGSMVNSWPVEFNGCTNTDAGSPRTDVTNVRCVRGNGLRPSTASEHYTSVPAEDGSAGAGSLASETTVVDNWTGLTWEGRGMAMVTRAEAATYCEGLGDGFRMPTIKELVTLVDPSRLNPAIEVAVFPGTSLSSSYWSSTYHSWSGCCGDNYHTVDFRTGASIYSTEGSLLNVRCVHH